MPIPGGLTLRLHTHVSELRGWPRSSPPLLHGSSCKAIRADKAEEGPAVAPRMGESRPSEVWFGPWPGCVSGGLGQRHQATGGTGLSPPTHGADITGLASDGNTL